MKIVLLHGLGQGEKSWDKVKLRLINSEETYCPGLLQRDSSGILYNIYTMLPITYHLLYSGLEKYCEQFEEPFCMCGLSLGAVLALQYGIEHPEKLSSLVLIAPQYTMPRLLLRLQNFAFRLMPDASFMDAGLLKQDMISLCKSMMDLDFTSQLGKLRCRTLIVCGARDKANKLSAHRLHRLLPSSELKIISRAGHAVNTEAPDALSSIINDFLNI